MPFIKLTGDIALNWALRHQQRLSHFRPEVSAEWMRTHFALYLLNTDWGFRSRDSRRGERDALGDNGNERERTAIEQHSNEAGGNLLWGD